ncbi:MAG: efflux RND transporter periplasmic adaptor subunit [Gallionella sp.]
MIGLKLKASKNYYAAALMLSLVSSAAVWLMGSGLAEQSAPAVSRPALTVRTVQLGTDKWSRTLSANGTVIPWQEAIISGQLQGLRIAEVMAGIGDQVRQGDVLVTLGNFAHSDLTNSPASVQGKILAPDDGVISAANAIVGSMSQPGVELFRLIRKGKLEWRAELTADELMQLRKGMAAQIMLSDGRVISGTVRAISPSVDATTRYGYAFVSLHQNTGIVAGAFVRGSFNVSGGQKTLATLPQSAVMQRGKVTYVLVVGSDSRAHEREVVAGQRIGDRVEISKGLDVKESVVESGGPFLTEGDVVLVVKE